MFLFRYYRCFLFLLVLTIGGLPCALWGQSGANTGLSGTVTDRSGAAVSGARVIVVRVDTAEERATQSDASGNWEVRFLTVGSYEVTVEAENFQTTTLEGIDVTTGEVARLPLQLSLGQQTDSVTVTAEAEMVQRDSAAIVRELDAQELEELPTSSRNFTQLLVIEPGVSADVSELLSNNNANVSPSVNGTRTTANSFLFNGVDATNLLCCDSRINRDRGTVAEGGGSLSRNIAPAPETLAEVKLQTSLYDASTGRNGGGSFQLVSKSGSNDFHGSVYHYFQNDKLIANDFFFNRADIDRQKLQRNEGGFAVGGPVVRNKTFFFGSYQHTRANTAYVDEASNTVRLPQALSDDRSIEGLRTFAEALGANPNALNPTSVQLLQAKFPDGTLLMPSGANGNNCEEDDGGVSCQVTTVIPATYRQNQFSANIDHHFSNNRLSGKFFFANQPSKDPLSDPLALSLFEEEENNRQRVLSVTDTHIFGPTVINEFRGGVFFNRNDTLPVTYFTNSEFGINNPLAGERTDLASFFFEPEDVGSDFAFGTPENSILDKQTSFTFGDTLSIQSSRHFLKTGGELRHHRLEGDYQETKNAQYAFASWKNFLTVGEEEDGEDAEQIDEASLSYGETVRDFRMTDYSLFVADDWKVSPNLTLNLGLRWDLFGWPSEANGRIANYDLGRGLASGRIEDGYIFAKNYQTGTLPDDANLPRAETDSTLSTDWNNIAPRFGFAWSPFDSRGLVVRGGYGFYYDRPTGGFINALRRSPPFFREQQLNDLGDYNDLPQDRATFPLPNFIVGFDDGEPFLASEEFPDDEFEALEALLIDPQLGIPYVQQWNLTLQVPLSDHLLIDVGYVGTKGTGLLQAVNLNPPVDVNATGFLARPNVPGGGFASNYYTTEDDEFVPTPEPTCDVTDDYEDCTIVSELRVPILGFDEDEGLNTVTPSASSTYHALQASFQQRYSRGLTYKVNYTWSKSIDNFSDEGLLQAEHDQRRLFLNRAVSDFDRTQRLIFSFIWDLPLRGNRLLDGWSLSGIGTFQSGRPFSIIDDADFSAFLFASTAPRPNIADGATHGDLETAGSPSERVGNYINQDVLESSGAQFGNLGRNIMRAPVQKRVDLSLMKQTRLSERVSIDFRAEAYNLTNTPNFRPPRNILSEDDFGEIIRSQGGPRVFQLSLRLRF